VVASPRQKSSAVVVLLWLYFSAQMLLFGAEFTQVYARRHEHGLSEREDAQQREAAASPMQQGRD
jgi:membrane protein